MENSLFSAPVSTRENFFYFFINKQKWFRTFLPYTKKELLDLEEERTTGPNLTGSGPTCLLHEAQHLDINPRDPNPGNHGLVVFKNFPISRERKQKLKELAATTKKEAIAKLAQKDSTGSFSLFQDIDNFVKYYTTDRGKYYFEVVFAQNHQKPRFDVDISFADFAPYLTELELSDKETVMILMDFECQKVLDILVRTIYKLIPELNISKDIIICTSHSRPEEPMDSQKRSLHIIVNNYFHENNQEAQMFFEDVISFIPEALRFIVRWIDHSVYKSMQQFRILGSTKVKKNRTKIFCEDFLFENEIIHHIYSDRALLKNSGTRIGSGEKNILFGLDSGTSSIPNFFLPSPLEQSRSVSTPEDEERMIKKKFVVQLRESLLTETHNCTHLIWERPGTTDNGEKILSIDAILKMRRGVYGSEERSGSPSAVEGEEEFYFENHELEKKHAKKAFAMLEKMMGIGYKERAFPYEYNRREKGMVLMKRIRPSLCRICKAVHENEHPYIFFVKNRQEPTLTELKQFYENYFSQENKAKKYSSEDELNPMDLVDDLIIDENDANRTDKMAFSIMFDCRRSFSHLGYEKKLFLGYMSEDASTAILSCLLSPMMNSLDRKLEKEKIKKPLKINEFGSNTQQRNIDYFAAPLISNHIKQPCPSFEIIVVNPPKAEQIVEAEVVYEKKKNKELWEELIVETNFSKKKKNKAMPALSSPPIMINNTSNMDRNLLTRRTESVSSFQYDSNRNSNSSTINFVTVPKLQRRTDLDLLRNPKR